MHPKYLSIKDFTYNLPEERIAKFPSKERDDSKLLVYRHGKITQDIYRNIHTYIPENSLLIFNDTKVVEARLIFQKSSGGRIEIFCLAPDERYPDIITALQQQGKVLWQCLIGGASKWKHGQILEKKISSENSQKADQKIILRVIYKEKKADAFIIELSWMPSHFSFAEILHYAGVIPLPPYIKRQAEKSDSERYQTIYAHSEGSVASPTAGLHFTETIFRNLNKKNIQTDFITLHVGAGTFKPVKSEIMEQHEMHSEFIDVSKKTIENILLNLQNDIICVGTTSLRTIESLYWQGVKIKLNPSAELLSISQWETYDLETENILVKDSLQSLLNWMVAHQQKRLVTKTQIIIAPGYKPKIAKALITNFHQPQSTLLLLVAALIDEIPNGISWRKIYEYALKNNFRFLSYGDGSLLWIN